MRNPDEIITAIGALEDGWSGEQSKAPSPSVSADIVVALAGMAFAKEPDVEVDPDDGSVILRWLKASESFSLTFLGKGNVAGCYLPSTEPAAWRVPVGEASKFIKESINKITNASE
jgi:hypothetical protein